MPALLVPIPPGKAAHWKLRDDGVIEVEFLRFLSPQVAKSKHLHAKGTPNGML